MPSDKSNTRHILLAVEVPCMYTDDIIEGGELRGYRDHFASDSDFILNTIGEPGVVRLRMEISGEKDSTIVEVWGSVREASLIEPSRGYSTDESHLTDGQLADHGWKLMRDDGTGCEWCDLPCSDAETGKEPTS